MAGKKDIVEQALKFIMGAGEEPVKKAIKAYHVSPNDFDTFKPSEFRGSTFFASTAERAKRGANAARNEMVMETATDLPPASYKTYEVEIDPAKIKGLSLTPSEIEWFGNLPQKIVGDDALAAATKQGMPHGLYWDDFYDYAPVSEGVFEYIKKAVPPSISYEDAYKTGKDVYRRQHPHYAPDADEKASAERMRQSGMGGYLVQDEAGTSLAVSDPDIVKILRKYSSGGRTGYAGKGRVIGDIVNQGLELAGKVLGGAEEPAQAGIRAYHGSPHDFDRFDLSKIGTGEGAQAYGHGLYFAENEGVAKGYRDALTDPNQVKIRVNDKHIPSVWTEDLRSTFPEMYKNLNPDDADTMDALLGTMESAYSLNDAANAAESVGGRARYLYNQRVKPFVTKPEVGKGSMYEVNINADPNTFLDWDKPLSEQSEAVRQAYANAMSGGDPDLIELLDTSPEGMQIMGLFPKSTGAQAYNTFVAGNRPLLTQKLREAGIPGIKYLDAGSRSAGEGSRNYVVFDDKLISIIRKYGIAGASAMLGYNLLENLSPEQARAAQAANSEYKASGTVTGGMLPPGMEPSGELTSRTPTASERVYDYIRANLLGDEATKGQRAETAMNVLDQTPATIPLMAYDLGRGAAEALGFADGGAVGETLVFPDYDPDAEEAVALARREIQGPFPPSSQPSYQPSDGISVSRRPSKTERIIDILAPRVVEPAMQVKSLMDTPLHVLLGGGTPEEQDALIANSTNVASMMGGASSVVPRPANSVGIFGGIKSRTADKNALTKAQIMESQGASPDEIWRQAGWGRGAEEGWRYEIPDIGATVDPSKFQIDLSSLSIPSPKVAKLGDYLNHPEFFAAYPEMKNIEVRFQPGTALGNDYWGYYSPRYEKAGKIYEPYIGLNQDFLPTNEKQLSILLHEMQHAVQQKEGFMRGANKEMFQPDTIPDPRVKIYEDAIKNDPELQEFVSIGNSGELQKQFDAAHEIYMRDVKPVLDDIRSREDEYGLDLNDEWMKVYRTHLAQVREMFPLIAKREDLGQSLENRGIPLSRPMKKFLTPGQAYEATSGEVEARNVQKRMNTEPSILKESPPWVTESMPRNQQLIDWNDTSWRKGYAEGGEIEDDIDEALYIANGLNS